MRKISKKGRKLLRAIYLTLGAGVVSVVFQACYGSPPPTVRGQVLSERTKEPISGIKVSPDYSSNYYALTDSKGNFRIYVTKEASHVLNFEDTDSVGFFRKQAVTVGNAGEYLSVYLDEVDGK